MGILMNLSTRRCFVLGPHSLVGRSSQSLLRLDSRRVSGEHALLRWRNGQWWVRDLASANGTLLDCEPLHAPHRERAVAVGQTLRFGDDSERWTLVDGSMPDAVLVSEDGEVALHCQDGSICIPSPAKPTWMIRHDGSGWLLERPDEVRRIDPETRIELDGKRWRLEVPPQGLETTRQETWGRAASSFKDVRLDLEVSKDHEHVWVAASHGGKRTEFGSRACFYLLFVLGHARWGGGSERVRAALGPASPSGWVETERLIRALGRSGGATQLNVDTHRVRTAFSQAEIVDATSVIEREAGRMRVGTALGAFHP